MRATRLQFARRKAFIRRVGMTRHKRFDGSTLWVRVDRAKGVQHLFAEAEVSPKFRPQVVDGMTGWMQ